jgi:hypothetical protein
VTATTTGPGTATDDRVRRVAAGWVPRRQPCPGTLHPDARGPTISEVADYLLVRHHSVVQLVDRAERADLVVRVPDSHDGRIVRLSLSALGAARLGELAAATKEELSRLGSRLGGLWRGLQ